MKPRSIAVLLLLFGFGLLLVGCGGGRPPAADIQNPQDGSRSPTKEVRFQGGGKDAQGKSVANAQCEWNFGDGKTANRCSETHTYAKGGDYTVKLTVWTGSRKPDKPAAAQVKEIKLRVNADPIATIDASPQEGPAPLEVSYNGAGSSDTDGTVASYAWDFGDGQTATDPSGTHRYEKPGEYTLKLTVTDNDGSSATASITIKAAGGSPSMGGTGVVTVRMITQGAKQAFVNPDGSENAELHIKVGTTVRFVNESGIHTATAYADKVPSGAKAFDSGIMTEPGKTFDVTFTVPGTYEYYCVPHEALGMKAKIVVE